MTRKQPSKAGGQQRLRNRLYGSAAWQKVKVEVMARDRGICQVRSPVCRGRATVVDHIRDWKLGGAWYDSRNLRAACKACNAWRATSQKDGPSSSERQWSDCQWPGEYVGQPRPMHWSREWFRPSDDEIALWHEVHGLPPWKPGPDDTIGVIA